MAGWATPGTCSAILLDVREVAADEYLRMTRRIEVTVDEDAASPVGLNPEQLAQRRSLHPSGPQRNDRVDALVADHDIAGLHIA